MKEYRSFDEVDRDLKLLKLQNEIDKEELKLSIKHVKKEISPKELWRNLSAVIKRKALETKAMVKGAAEGFIEDFKEENSSQFGTELRVEPIENEIKPFKTEIIVEKVVVDTETTDANRNRPNKL